MGELDIPVLQELVHLNTPPVIIYLGKKKKKKEEESRGLSPQK